MAHLQHRYACFPPLLLLPRINYEASGTELRLLSISSCPAHGSKVFKTLSNGHLCWKSERMLIRCFENLSRREKFPFISNPFLITVERELSKRELKRY
jgi:hypothetical protein